MSRRKENRNRTEGLTPEEVASRKKSHFLRVYLENGGFMERAIKACHTSRRFIDEQREADEEFDAAIRAIRDYHNESLEHEIYRRAVLGNEKPLAYQGKLTGDYVREYSDNLLMFLAKANMPEKYRDLPRGKDAPTLTDEELDQRIGAYLKKRAVNEATDAVN